jgi:hypothetical protein
MLSTVLLGVIMLSAVILSVNRLSIVTLSVIALYHFDDCFYDECHYAECDGAYFDLESGGILIKNCQHILKIVIAPLIFNFFVVFDQGHLPENFLPP